MRTCMLLVVFSLLGCPNQRNPEDPTEQNTTVIIAALPYNNSCIVADSERIRRSIYDIGDITSIDNPQGSDFRTGLLVKDDITDQQSGIGSKRFLLNYSFGGNLRPPSQPTLNELGNGVEVPVGGFTNASMGNIIVQGDLIPERVAGLLAADPVIREELVFTSNCSSDEECPVPQRCDLRARRCVDPFNHVGGLPGYYQVQVKVQTVMLSERGLWIKSPAFYHVIDLCNGCLNRIPAVAVPDPEGESYCREWQNNPGQANIPPTFPNLAAAAEVIEQELPDDEGGGEGGGEGVEPVGDGGPGGGDAPVVGIGPTELLVTTVNSGPSSTTTAQGSADMGLSKTAVWLIHPAHANQREAPTELPDALRPPIDFCPVQNLTAEEDSVCTLQGHPKRCNGAPDQPLCLFDSDCAGGVSCLAPPTFAVSVAVPGGGEPEVQQRRCRVSSQDEDDPQAVDCVWMVCADYNNQVMEWKMDEDWDTLQSNCSCTGLNQEAVDQRCPLESD
ncbi:MAG: hypothetical protein VX405_05325 [Myxococcota bacterium]|nr:hypothetical protein [Myxococcota bacterium]